MSFINTQTQTTFQKEMTTARHAAGFTTYKEVADRITFTGEDGKERRATEKDIIDLERAINSSYNFNFDLFLKVYGLYHKTKKRKTSVDDGAYELIMRSVG